MDWRAERRSSGDMCRCACSVCHSMRDAFSQREARQQVDDARIDVRNDALAVDASRESLQIEPGGLPAMLVQPPFMQIERMQRTEMQPVDVVEIGAS